MKFPPISLATSIAIVSIYTLVNFSTIDATTASMTGLPPNQLISLNQAQDLLPKQKNGKWGYVDSNNAQKIKFIYDEAGYFNEGLAEVKIGGKHGFINAKGKQVIALNFDEAKAFSEGVAPVKIGEKWGYIDATGKQLIKPQFEEVEDFKFGLAIVKLDGKSIYINKTGKTIWAGEPR